MLRALLTAIAMALSLLSAPVLARSKQRIAVVASHDSPLGAMSAVQVRHYFLGEDGESANGERIVVIDQDRDAPIAVQFYNAVAGMTMRDISIYWAKKVFSGLGTPPLRIKGGDAAVKEWLKSKPHAIGYISAASADASVKTLLVIKP